MKENELEEKKNSLLLKEVEVNNLNKKNAEQHQYLCVQQLEIEKQLLNIDQQRKLLTSQKLEAKEKLPTFLNVISRLAQKTMSPSGFTTAEIKETFKDVTTQRGMPLIKEKWVKEF